MTDVHELPTLSSKGISGTPSADGQVKFPIIPTAHTYGRILVEEGDPPTIQPITVREFEAGDILYLALPLLAYKVVGNTFRRNIGGSTSRNILTLVDVTGEVRKYSFSPERQFHTIVKGSLGLAPWAGLPLEEVMTTAKEDALLNRVVDPVSRPLRSIIHMSIDLQCYIQSLRIHSGFLTLITIFVVFSLAQPFDIPTASAVAISIVGAFLVEQYWVYWKQHVRRKLSKGYTTRVRFHPFGNANWSYATLRVDPDGGLVTGDKESPSEHVGVWFSTKLSLSHRKKILAICTFANDARGDQFRTGRNIADAIRHRIDDGSNRAIYCRSTKSDPDKDTLGDIVIHPRKNVKEFDLSIADHESRKHFSLRLKRYQMRMLADALEVMDQGRRL